jgi:hypothetical protein
MTLRLLQRRLPRLRRPRQCRKTCVGESGAGNHLRRRRRRLRPRPRRLLHHPLSHLPPLRLAPCPFSSRGLQSVACASLTLRTPMGRRRASSRPAYPARLGDSGATRVCNRARGPSSGPTSDVAASSSARMGSACDVGALGPGPASTARATRHHPPHLRIHITLPCPRDRPDRRRWRFILLAAIIAQVHRLRRFRSWLHRRRRCPRQSAGSGLPRRTPWRRPLLPALAGCSSLRAAPLATDRVQRGSGCATRGGKTTAIRMGTLAACDGSSISGRGAAWTMYARISSPRPIPSSRQPMRQP